MTDTFEWPDFSPDPNEMTVNCVHCGYKTNNFNDMQRHMDNQHVPATDENSRIILGVPDSPTFKFPKDKNTNMTCQKCNFVTNRANIMVAHVMQEHPESIEGANG